MLFAHSDLKKLVVDKFVVPSKNMARETPQSMPLVQRRNLHEQLLESEAQFIFI